MTKFEELSRTASLTLAWYDGLLSTVIWPVCLWWFYTTLYNTTVLQDLIQCLTP